MLSARGLRCAAARVVRRDVHDRRRPGLPRRARARDSALVGALRRARAHLHRPVARRGRIRLAAPELVESGANQTLALSDQPRAPPNQTRAPSNPTRASPHETRAPPNQTRAPTNQIRAPSNQTRAPPNQTRTQPNQTRASPNQTRAPSNYRYRSVYLLAGDAWRRRPYLPMSHMDALHRTITRTNTAAASISWCTPVSNK